MTLMWIAILWTALAAEHARPDLLASGSLVIPLAAGCLFWLSSARGVLISGGTMILLWLLRSPSLPVDVLAFLTVATQQLFSLTAPRWVPTQTRRRIWTDSQSLVFVTLIVLTVHSFSVAETTSVFLSATASRLIVGLPIAAFLAIAFRFSDDLGLRQRPTSGFLKT